MIFYKSIKNKYFFFKSLQVRITFTILFLIFIPAICLLTYNFSHTEHVLQEKSSKLIIDNLKQIGNKIEDAYQDIMKISNLLSSDEVVTRILQQDFENKMNEPFQTKRMDEINYNDALNISKIESRINYVKSSIFFNYNTHVLIFGYNGVTYSSIDDINDEVKFKTDYMKTFKAQEWYKRIVSCENTIFWTAPFNYGTEDFTNSHFISLSRAIKSNYSDQLYGLMMVNFSEKNFKTITENNVSGVVFLLNENKNIIFSSNLETAMKQIPFGEISSGIPENGEGYSFVNAANGKYMVNYYSIERLNWTLVSVIPYSEVMEDINSLKLKTYYINFIALILFVVISIGLIIYITNPLNKLIKNIKSMKIGDYNIDIGSIEYSDDVNKIIRSFDFLFSRIKELVNTVIEEQKTEQELRYAALRAQINPHFLFNTLNIIKWSAIMSGADNVSKMITSLGMLLENSMNRGEDDITFREEIELIKAYIYIQNVRFNDKVTMKFYVDDDVYELKLLKYILQPIIENSLIHGLKDKEINGVIEMRASVEGNKVRICIIDNGRGMSEEKIQEVLSERIEDNDMKRYNRIGLKNVNDRIMLRYGENFGLKILSAEEKGTKVFISLPIIK